MKTTKFIAIILISFLFFANCDNNKKDNDKKKENLTNLVGGSVLYLTRPGTWTKITPTSGSIDITVQTGAKKSFNYNPSCSNFTGTDPTYSFFVKRGTSSNLLVNFMGGGACWDNKNCLGADATRMYFPQLGSLSLINLAEASKLIDVGILNHNRSDNPFKDWNMVFIPYCTGDVFWGSNDATYSDPITGEQKVIRHRGFDNFLSVLKYIRENFPKENMKQIFVTGQSAGGYGSIFNFPYIKETYNASNNKVYTLGDSAEGISPSSYIVDVNNKWDI